MIFISGFLIATFSILASIFELRQSALTYFDIVAMFMVLGGTAAVAVITMPWDLRTEIAMCFKFLIKGKTRRPRLLLIDAMKVVQFKGATDPSHLKGLGGEILRDGTELITLGFKADKIEAILGERIHQAHERINKVGHSVRSLAKYPPAFGLVGTVLGLVSLMRAVSDNANSQEIGIRMAVALVSTLYGLLMANLVLNPAGERMGKFAADEKRDGEIAMQGVLLAADDTPALEAHEMLNSFVQKRDRLQLNFNAAAIAEEDADADTIEESAEAA
jgi:chemotaxis protein MotA